MKNKGSMTIEATLILPLVFFMIFLVMEISIGFFQQVYVQSINDYVVERVSSVWGEERSPSTGEYLAPLRKDSFLAYYWRIFDFSGAEEAAIEDSIKNILSGERFTLMEGKSHGSVTVDVDFVNYLIYKKLVVRTYYDGSTPFDAVKPFFGMDPGHRILVESEAVINDPEELIRDLDFIVEESSYLTEKNIELVYFVQEIISFKDGIVGWINKQV